MTFREIYENWSEDKYEHTSKSTINGYRTAYNTCYKLYERKFRDLKTLDLQDIIDNCEKDYSKYVDISKFSDKNPDQYDRKTYSKEQLDILWDLILSNHFNFNLHRTSY